MGLKIKIASEMAELNPKVENSGYWRHLQLLRHFEVLKNEIFLL
jgi:hypothetical protein